MKPTSRRQPRAGKRAHGRLPGATRRALCLSRWRVVGGTLPGDRTAPDELRVLRRAGRRPAPRDRRLPGLGGRAPPVPRAGTCAGACGAPARHGCRPKRRRRRERGRHEATKRTTTHEENAVNPSVVSDHRSCRRPLGPASRIEGAREIESTVHSSGALDLPCTLDTPRANARHDRYQAGDVSPDAFVRLRVIVPSCRTRCLRPLDAKDSLPRTSPGSADTSCSGTPRPGRTGA